MVKIISPGEKIPQLYSSTRQLYQTAVVPFLLCGNMNLFEVRDGNFGTSVYATQLIREGASLLTFSGKPLLYEETKKLEEHESFALQRSSDFYLFLDEPCRYFNHSCEPNCGLRDLELVALREIAAEEELNYDYSTTMLERDWHLKCKCGKPSCRRVVGDFDRLPQHLQKKYLEKNVVQPFILERLNLKNISSDRVP